VASLTLALMAALSVVVPMLDAGDAFRGPGIESEHHASTCVVVHDHTICTQVSANRALTTHAPPPRRPATELVLPDPVSAAPPPAGRLAGTRLPRAPPFHRA
ncbi:MAG TPA: hypothetical protein VE173_08640, partial [Longimicrobiales bacterium]|jgi:hypothetical protein|nr:hypothetical protein [Longimicrobiales bacterium]